MIVPAPGAPRPAEVAGSFTPSMTISIALIFVINRYLAEVEKLLLIKLSLVYYIVVVCLHWFLWNPEYPLLALLSGVLFAPAMTLFWKIYPSIEADFCDYVESRNGLRREGSYSAASAWVSKVASSLSLMLSGAVLGFTGFRIGLGKEQSEETLLWMRILYIAIIVILSGIALAVAFRYPFTKQRMTDIATELRTKRQ